mmetsp:Transcript_19732/g.24346  ORF Transcript_19732/g.24346 Transcript_19732/m.24346 type:complete len:472 (-) Transcript_19732:9-1424(-)
MEVLLEVIGHVVGELANAVESSVSDLRVLVLQVLEDSGHHGSDLFDIVDVLTDLGESHDTSVLVAPVGVVGNGGLNELSDQGEHVGVTNASNKSVDGGLTEVDIVFFLVLAGEALLGAHPALVDVLINVDHELEDSLEHILGEGLVLLDKTGLSLDHGDDEFERLVSQSGACEVLVGHDRLELLVDRLEVVSEELGLDLGEGVKLNEGVLEDGLILLGESLGNDASHEGKQSDEVLGVLALSDGQVVAEGLQSRQLDVEGSEAESSLEDASELVLVLDEVVKDVAEQSVKDDQCGVNLSLLLTLDELEEEVEEVLPDGVVLLSAHGTLDLDSHIADLVHESLVCRVDLAEGLEEGGLHGVASLVGETFPQVGVVLLVDEIASIGGLSRDISAENDSGEGLGLDGDDSHGRIENACHQEGILVGLAGLGSVELVLGGLALSVVVGEDLLQNSADALEVLFGESLDHRYCRFE